MIRPNFLSFFAALLLAGPLLAQPRTGRTSRAVRFAPDSLAARTLALPEVAVAAARAAPFAVGSSRVVIDSAALSQYQNSSLADVLAARTPLYFKNYGAGQLASVSIRGTSARHTAVLWNGILLNSASLGEADFAMLPVGGNTQVQVQPGPAGALYGSGAVGGAVLLSGLPAWGGGLRGQVQADLGSFGLGGGSAAVGGGGTRRAWRSTALFRAAQNNFPLAVPDQQPDGPAYQPNAAFRQWNFTHDHRLRLGRHGQLALAAWLGGADRQIQPGLGAANRHGRQLDRNARLLAEFKQQATPHYEALLRLALVADVLRFGDDALAASSSRLATTTLQTEHTLTLTARATLRLGLEGQYFVAAVPDYQGTRREYRGAAYALLRLAPAPGLRLSAGLRQALLPGRRPPLAPALGLEWEALPARPGQPGPRLLFKATAAGSYRAPTLNERYWNPGGNPALLPETSQGAEAGFRTAHALGRAATLHTEATAYWQRVDDWVQWLPGPNGFYAPRNLRQVQTKGLEIRVEAEVRARRTLLTSRLAYGYTDARKLRGYAADSDPVGLPLPLVPAHTATGSAELAWRTRWLASAGGSFVSYRYTTVSANDFLPGFGLVQAGLGRHFGVGHFRTTLLINAYNLNNVRYQTYPNRAMPPANWQVSLRLAWL